MSVKLQTASEQLAFEIDALLPQTQCRRCGYSGCQPYARAIAEGKAEINQCPPGGAQGIRKLAALLGREFKPLNPEHGVEKPDAVAFIDENVCIGCTLCAQACPVDAIVGAAKQMHTVVADWCTGCELCLSPCPVDCIAMLPASGSPAGRRPASAPRDASSTSQPAQAAADQARTRYQFRLYREEREKQEKAARLAAKTAASRGQDPRQALIAAAIARAQAQKERIKPKNTQQLTPGQIAQIAEIEARRSTINESDKSLPAPTGDD